jgi:hypothetical protein
MVEENQKQINKKKKIEITQTNFITQRQSLLTVGLTLLQDFFLMQM